MRELDLIGLRGGEIWGWEIPTYLFLGGLTAGIMVVTALITRRVPRERLSKWMRWMPLLAPLVLSIGMGALLLDLDSKLHVFRFYTAFRITSPMSWGSWILLLIYPATVLLAFRRTPFMERANVILGVALGVYTGILLAALGRPLWSSAILGPLFLVSGLSTGAALILLFPIAHEEHEAIRRFDIGMIGVEVVLLALFFFHLNGALPEGYVAPFWALVVIAGLAVPLTFELLESHLHLKGSAIASVLLLVGGFVLRWIFVAAGQAV